MNRIKKLLSIILILAILVGGVYAVRNFKVKNEVETLTSNVEENIVNMAELSTVKYNYTNIAEFKDKMKFSGIDIPFTNKTFLVKYSGYIKAGVLADDMEIKIESPDKAVVNLGQMKILDNVIIEEEVYFYNEKDSAFNRLKLDDLYDLLKEEKSKTEVEVLDKGILNDAKKNAENIIRTNLSNMGVTEIVFK